MKRAFLFAGLLAATFASSALGEDRVLVLPFGALNVPESQRWIAKGVFENLVADLGRSGKFAPVAFGGQVIVEDNATAARLARNAEAPLAVRGSAQVVGDQVRLTAQLIDSRTGDTVRTALVTGTTPDLLKMEDELASQIRGVAQPAIPLQASTPASPAPVVVMPPVIVISPPQPAYSPYDYAYAGYAPYPYYNYGTWPILLYSVNNTHHGHGEHNHGGGENNPGTNNGGQASGTTQVANNDFNPTGLPIPSGNVLPIPSGNVLPIPSGNLLPIPTNNVLPVPTNNVLPNPTSGTLRPVMTHSNSPLPASGSMPLPGRSFATPLPTSNAGVNRNPRLIN